jgi:hypothetical protein
MRGLQEEEMKKEETEINEIVFRNGIRINFTLSKNIEDNIPYIGTNKVYFCPECGCPTHKASGALMCDCAA